MPECANRKVHKVVYMYVQGAFTVNVYMYVQAAFTVNAHNDRFWFFIIRTCEKFDTKTNYITFKTKLYNIMQDIQHKMTACMKHCLNWSYMLSTVKHSIV